MFYIMSFWKNVDNELIYRGITRKELSSFKSESVLKSDV